MTTATMTRGIPKRPAPTLACQRVGGCPASTTVTALGVAALLVAASLLCVWSRIEVVRQGYDNAAAAKQLKELTAEQEDLRVQAARLRSPDRIEAIAKEKLGMLFPKPEQIINLENSGQGGENTYLASRRAP
jgi:cell division protein FtsL